MPADKKPNNKKVTKPSSKKDSLAEDLFELVDPTGISSYDDVKDAYNRTGLSFETGMEALGALPGIGPFGKTIKGLKIGSDIFKEAQLSKLLRYLDSGTKLDQLQDVATSSYALGGGVDKGKEFAEDRTKRGYYYYLGESNKSKLLDSLAFAKSRLTPYAEGGFLDEYLEEGDGDKKSKPTTRAGIDKELLIRQQFKESSFNPKAKSGANARGLAQIMENVEQDALKAGVLKKGEDIYDPKVNAKVQKWYMEDLYNSSFINKPGQKEDVKKAKVLASYNYGRGNILKHLNEQKAKGVDIYNSYDWLKGLPAETTDYVEKILLKKDPKFEKEYFKAVKNYSYKANGGWLDNYANDGYMFANGGKFITVDGEYHRVYENKDGDIVVNHPREDKGKWDTINLTDKANAKTVADGVKSVKKWHKENPETKAKGGWLNKYM